MKYKLWWIALVAVALYFGFGILALLATGSTYLYLPLVPEGDWEAKHTRAGFVITDTILAFICAAWAGLIASDGDHLKKKEKY